MSKYSHQKLPYFVNRVWNETEHFIVFNTTEKFLSLADLEELFSIGLRVVYITSSGNVTCEIMS